MTDTMLESKEVVSAWRHLQARRRDFGALIKDWDSLADACKNGRGKPPSEMRRSLLKEIRAAETRFRDSMAALEKAVD